VKDWEAINLLNKLINEVENLPSPHTGNLYADEKVWETRQTIHRLLLDERKPYVDQAYQKYLDNGRKPWCDECGYMVRWDEFIHGWGHVLFNNNTHDVTTHEYTAGWNSEILKRLKFEIE
jgi:hypothetical protein